MAANGAQSVAILGMLPQEVATLHIHHQHPAQPLEQVRVGGARVGMEQVKVGRGRMGKGRLQKGGDLEDMAYAGSHPLF